MARSSEHTDANVKVDLVEKRVQYFTYQGYSGIFAFPFYIQAQESISRYEVVVEGVRYRIYEPFLRRPESLPLTDNVPFELWPEFRWHPDVPTDLRQPLAKSPAFRYSKTVYDGLRVDIIGAKDYGPLLPFVRMFMRCLRVLSAQPWIGDVDYHVEPTLKTVFQVKEDGTATGEATPVSEMLAITMVRLVTNEMWRKALQSAAMKCDAPIYWDLFFDAANARARSDYRLAIMLLAMALEACRNLHYASIHPSRRSELRGPSLKPPFNTNDLVEHIGPAAQKVFGTSFATDEPDDWSHLQDLYHARGNVAHRKPPVYDAAGTLQAVDDKIYDTWEKATGKALFWIQALPSRVKKLIA